MPEHVLPPLMLAMYLFHPLAVMAVHAVEVWLGAGLALLWCLAVSRARVMNPLMRHPGRLTVVVCWIQRHATQAHVC